MPAVKDLWWESIGGVDLRNRLSYDPTVVFLYMNLDVYKFNVMIVKTTDLLVELIAAIFVVYNRTSPLLCTPWAVLTFILGAMEGRASFS